MARIAISVVGLDGEEQEARLVQREMASYWAGVQAVYRRAVGQALAEQQQEQARQQSLLILFGGLQQINQNLQAQDRYNQQQRYQQEQQFYQQRLLHELSKPIRCHTSVRRPLVTDRLQPRLARRGEHAGHPTGAGAVPYSGARGCAHATKH